MPGERSAAARGTRHRHASTHLYTQLEDMIRGMLPTWAGIVVILSMPVAQLLAWTVIGGRLHSQGKKVGAEEQARFGVPITLASFAVSGGLGVYLAQRYDVSSSSLRLEPLLTVEALAAAIALGVVGGIVISRGTRALVDRLQGKPEGCGPEPDVPLLPTLTVGILAGVCEEWVFRGVGFSALEVNHGVAVAVIVTSVLFGLAHAWKGLAPVITCGVPGATVYLIPLLVFDSLLAGMIAHALWNTTETLADRRAARARRGTASS